ncbi:MAG: hypothetical protein R6W92_14820 [Desulfocurvibacter africanus]
MKIYKIVCIATSILFIFLFFQLLFDSVSFVKDMGMQPSEATSVLAKRAAIFMLGLSILAFCAKSLPHSKARQYICLSTGSTLIGLACMGTYEHFMGTVNSSIFIAIAVETTLGLSFLAVLYSDKAAEKVG